MRINRQSVRVLAWVVLFGISFGFVEASVVVYLRALYYPEGFHLPLKVLSQEHIVTEVAREAATIFMLVSVALIAGSRTWERFGYFLVIFGVWDILYYVWLKVVLNWPVSLTEWDILFLIPLPWIGPVIAPALVALGMVVFGAIIVLRVSAGEFFRPCLLSWLLSIGATILLLYSFMSDVAATTRGQFPVAYRYELLTISLLMYAAGFVLACRMPTSRSRSL